jgi:peptide/nickel transport system permease protein
MAQYAVRRLLQVIPILFVTSLLLFGLLRVLPGDPASFMLGDKGTPDQVAAMHRQMGLDRPLPLQYVDWLSGLAHGNFGKSLINGTPVLQVMQTRFPATVQLTVGALLVAIVLGVPVGLLGALFSETPLARLVAWFNAFFLAVPVFWLGILLALLVGIQLKWLPPSGYVSFTTSPLQATKLLILPSLTLGLGIAAVLARFLQTAATDVLVRDFVRTARAKGLPERVVVLRHVLGNAMIPVVTVMGLQLGALLGGAVITEAIFSIPGIGQLLWVAISRRDYYVIQFLVLFIVILVIAVNLLTDLTYAFLDPRIRYR